MIRIDGAAALIPVRVRNVKQAIELFRAARRGQGVMQKDLARMLHVGVDSIRRWEQSRRDIRAEDFLALADAVGYDIVAVPRQREGQTPIAGALPRVPSATDAAQNRAVGIPGPPKAPEGESGASEAVECWHCGGPRRGYATAAGMPLCHPDSGPDCYRLVVIYNHPMPCTDCAEETR